MTRSPEDLEDRLRRVLTQAAEELHVSPATWHEPPPGSRRRRFPRPTVANGVVVAGLAIAALVAVVALVSLHGPGKSMTSTTPRPASTVKAGVTASSVAQALLRQKGPPHLTAASCRAPTAGERASAQIGGADSVFFSCGVTVDGQAARFYVQVLSDGSFIAAREPRDQQQIFGCCVAHTSG
jgi:hypothetical protein